VSRRQRLVVVPRLNDTSHSLHSNCDPARSDHRSRGVALSSVITGENGMRPKCARARGYLLLIMKARPRLPAKLSQIFAAKPEVSAALRIRIGWTVVDAHERSWQHSACLRTAVDTCEQRCMCPRCAPVRLAALMNTRRCSATSYLRRSVHTRTIAIQLVCTARMTPTHKNVALHLGKIGYRIIQRVKYLQ
jgi:hypothetical protein